MKKHLNILLLGVALLSLAACQSTSGRLPTITDAPLPIITSELPASKPPDKLALILATTTSTRDSGLLDVLLPIFEEKTGLTVQMVAVGTGEALKMGEGGNADVLLVHAPKSEITFMENGFGKQRELIMHNDFVIVGPADDPAGIKAATSGREALSLIANTNAPFASRADDSGTHKMEISLWTEAEITPEGDWYLETGQGMAETLRIASEKFAYTLTDRATYLFQMENLDLEILYKGDPSFLNIYHAISVNPEIWPLVNSEGAQAFLDFLISPDTQTIIRDYGKDRFGQPLFIPDFGKDESNLSGS